VPVSGISDLECYVAHKVINGHCDCMLLYNTYGWEWTTIAALIAPRPLLFVNSDADSLFPMDGNRRIIGRLRQAYKLYDKPDLIDDYVSTGGHAYRPDLRVAVFRWINKHLKNDAGPVHDADFEALPGADLRVFPEDKDIPADALNGKIDETFVARADASLPREGEYTEWKKRLMKGLRERPFRAFPERIPAATPDKAVDEANGVVLRTEGSIDVVSTDAAASGKGGGKTGLLIVLNGDDGASDAVPEWAKPYAGDGPVRLLAPRGSAAYLPWTRKSPPNYLERALPLLGRTEDEGKVWDVAAAARYLSDHGGAARKWRVIGRGQAGVIGGYAALFEPSIQEVIAVDPPASHRDGPIFLGVLRVLDAPDALGMLAPLPLTLVGARGNAFERTAHIYKIAGAGEQLHRQ
jgi:hypothetical protein